MLLGVGAVTVVLTVTDRACRWVSVVGREEGVGDTSTRVWPGLRKRTAPLGTVAAAALMGTGTWRPAIGGGLKGVWLASLDEVLSVPPSFPPPPPTPLPMGHSVNFASGTSGFLTMTGESRKAFWDTGTTRRAPPSGVRGEGGVEDISRGGGETAVEDGGLLEEGVVTPLGREKVGVCVWECEAGV